MQTIGRLFPIIKYKKRRVFKMGLLDKIKADAQKSGGSKSKFFYVKDGDKRRIRFLQDMDDGVEVTFHDSYEANINIPCREVFGKSCPYCEEEGLRTRIQYAWSIWDYDANEVKVFMFPMNNCTPIGQVAAMYETYGTLLDRDFVVQRTGKQQNTSYTIIPMDKNKFRNEKAKPFSKKAFLELLDKAYPDEHADMYEDEPSKKMKPKSKKAKDEDEDEEDVKELPWGGSDTDDEEDENDYSGKSPKELYKLCKERNIEALPKKNEKYYINLLVEDDKAHDEWEDDDDEEDDDEWE